MEASVRILGGVIREKVRADGITGSLTLDIHQDAQRISYSCGTRHARLAIKTCWSPKRTVEYVNMSKL
jgi:hypothetical protein